jgi:hypothetical protein
MYSLIFRSRNHKVSLLLLGAIISSILSSEVLHQDESNSSMLLAKGLTEGSLLVPAGRALENSRFEARLERLERLVVERADIVEDYNLQQLDDTSVAVILKDYIWKALKSRPLVRFMDPR